MDPTKVPTSSLYIFMAVGGLTLAAGSVGHPIQLWSDIANERFTLEEQESALDVDWERWYSEHVAWNAAIKIRDESAAAIELKKNFGPTEPLTKAEEESLRKQIDLLPEPHADADRVIELQNLLRQMERESPTREEFQQAYDSAKKIADRFGEKSDAHMALAEKVDKARKSVEVKARQLAHHETVAFRLTMLCAVGIIAGAVIASFGFRWWYVRHQVHVDRELKSKGQ